MVTILSLWLPILISAVAIFFASAIAWMLLPHHNADYKKLPNESAVNDLVISQNLQPGMYVFPFWKDMTDEQRKECMTAPAGKPLGILHVWPAKAFAKMGQNMAVSFLFYLVVSIFIAYVLSETLPAGIGFKRVFQIAGTLGIMSYCLAYVPNTIWFNVPLRTVVMNLVDGVVYGLLTGLIFALLWPGV